MAQRQSEARANETTRWIMMHTAIAAIGVNSLKLSETDEREAAIQSGPDSPQIFNHIKNGFW